jgi:signal transduction histidine kinase
MTITDTGIGIEPDHLDRIFDPFWQVEQKATRRAGGTGLGLSVSRRLARLLGGDVLVASEPGRGSSFTVVLPVGAAADSNGARASVARAEPAGSGAVMERPAPRESAGPMVATKS